MKVRKRNGEIVDWDDAKIVAAIKAAGASNPQLLGEMVTKQLLLGVPYIDNLTSNEVTIDVEKIQDTCEEILMSHDSIAAKAFILYRQERAELRQVRPDGTAIANYIHLAKYARYNDELMRRETWDETCDRVMRMHIKKFPLLTDDIKDAFGYVRRKEVMPSMRSLQFAGPSIKHHNARMYNCCFTLLDRWKAFSDSFYLLLCGCGVGYSVQGLHVDQLPEIKPMKKVFHWTVEDSIEGWADSLLNLLVGASYGEYFEFNFSQIRPEGSPLTSGGVAPGHLPLKRTLDKIRELLVLAAGRKLRPIECHDIMCFMAEAVLSGGIRRSSLIALFSPTDEAMMNAKTPEEVAANPQRALANNSAVMLRSKTTEETFRAVMGMNLKCWGEPGFFFTNNLDHGCNPCGEIGLDPVLREFEDEENGETRTGFAFCNLTEVNGATCKDAEDFFKRVRIAAFIGTLQASYTDFPYLGPVSEEIAKRDALLGVGITGMMDNAGLLFNEEILTEAACVALDENEHTAQAIGINIAKRVTTIKPSGTSSLLLGNVGSGIHPHHAKRCFRRITANPLESVAQFFRLHNPHMVETKSNGDWVITFPTHTNGITAKEISAIEFLAHINQVYRSWILGGTRGMDEGELTHNVSATIVFKPEEFEELVTKIWENRQDIASATLLPFASDKLYDHAPREEVVGAVDAAKWEALVNNFKAPPYEKMVETSAASVSNYEVECAGQSCAVEGE